MSITVNLEKSKMAFNDNQLEDMYLRAESAHVSLFSKKGKGNDFLGWIDLPEKTFKMVDKINEFAEEIKQSSEVLVVIGIGGSYLGARSAIEFIKSPSYNLKDRDGCPQIFFVGNNMSADHMSEIVDIIGDRDYSINVISKSGTTVEPAIAFHFFGNMLKKKYKDSWTDRIYVTTDEKKGDLRKFIDRRQCKSFVIDDDVGGRFSVLSAVGLLPIACAGIDIKQVLNGAFEMKDKLKIFSKDNEAVKYAVARNLAYENGKCIEILGAYEPRFKFIGEWWKQLFGESEGKEQKGIFPATAELSTDLHSIGQYIQDGKRILFETIVNIENPIHNVIIENTSKNFERLAVFEGLTLDSVNKMALSGTVEAHVEGGVPNILISITDAKEKTYGEMVYFFEVACAISAYILDVNPFDQPGVEDYKREMIKLVSQGNSMALVSQR